MFNSFLNNSEGPDNHLFLPVGVSVVLLDEHRTFLETSHIFNLQIHKDLVKESNGVFRVKASTLLTCLANSEARSIHPQLALILKKAGFYHSVMLGTTRLPCLEASTLNQPLSGYENLGFLSDYTLADYDCPAHVFEPHKEVISMAARHIHPSVGTFIDTYPLHNIQNRRHFWLVLTLQGPPTSAELSSPCDISLADNSPPELSQEYLVNLGALFRLNQMSPNSTIDPTSPSSSTSPPFESSPHSIQSGPYTQLNQEGQQFDFDSIFNAPQLSQSTASASDSGHISSIPPNPSHRIDHSIMEICMILGLDHATEVEAKALPRTTSIPTMYYNTKAMKSVMVQFGFKSDAIEKGKNVYVRVSGTDVSSHDLLDHFGWNPTTFMHRVESLIWAADSVERNLKWTSPVPPPQNLRAAYELWLEIQKEWDCSRPQLNTQTRRKARKNRKLTVSAIRTYKGQIESNIS
ncbi:hypothetical protein C8J56DRAFT_1051314 [Mycena floridula]|nr:hypothetical protein C8J56DRAFT_1051314 [Mycena floridula]